MSIQAIFWDYDNTILATEEIHWLKHQVVLARHGIQLDTRYRKRVYENNGSQNWHWLKNELGLEVLEKEYLEDIDTEFQRHITTLEARPGVFELFEFLRELAVPQAIITNARRSSAEPVLNAKGISPFMDFILYKEDYEGRKPDPTPYLCGISRMETILKRKLLPGQCLAIEDDPKGVESAHKAGLIVIHRKLNGHELNCPFANYCCFQKNDFLSIVKSFFLSS